MVCAGGRRQWRHCCNADTRRPPPSHLTPCRRPPSVLPVPPRPHHHAESRRHMSSWRRRGHGNRRGGTGADRWRRVLAGWRRLALAIAADAHGALVSHRPQPPQHRVLVRCLQSLTNDVRPARLPGRNDGAGASSWACAGACSSAHQAAVAAVAAVVAAPRQAARLVGGARCWVMRRGRRGSRRRDNTLPQPRGGWPGTSCGSRALAAESLLAGGSTRPRRGVQCRCHGGRGCGRGGAWW